MLYVQSIFIRAQCTLSVGTCCTMLLSLWVTTIQNGLQKLRTEYTARDHHKKISSNDTSAHTCAFGTYESCCLEWD